MYAEGSLRGRKFTNKDGIEKYTAEIRIEEMQMHDLDDMDDDIPRFAS